jgi:hypothetical protein
MVTEGWSGLFRNARKKIAESDNYSHTTVSNYSINPCDIFFVCDIASSMRGAARTSTDMGGLKTVIGSDALAAKRR